jgi:hypothetical protein
MAIFGELGGLLRRDRKIRSRLPNGLSHADRSSDNRQEPQAEQIKKPQHISAIINENGRRQ